MADTLLAFGVQKLWELLVQESERFQAVEEQFNELKSDINMLSCFLKDADAKKHTSAMVRNIVKEIKEIVCDAEDIIETFLLKEKLGKTSGIRKRARRFSCVIVERRGLDFKMEAISKRISKVIRDMQSLGVQQVIIDDRYMQSLQERQREMRQTFSNDNESVLVGLEKNVTKLVGYLVEQNSSQVVSITGMGGIGKTTLARQVFNHETVKSHFEGLAWVCVSQHFTREYVWRTILQKLSPECQVSKEEEDQLQEKLFEVLETQKPLIVLDDMWREEDWDRIKAVFPQGKGWKVLVTSRNEGVALRADPTCFIFRPDCLILEESWTLFQKIAFPRENTSENKVDEEMEEMGKQMIKHCGGLPLAIKVLGGLLAAQYTLREWKRIYENIKSHIVGGTSFNDRDISSVYHVLYLSFEELPLHLKHCFLYLAHFPEDYPINVGDLSYYWAAEGIPKPRFYDGSTIREVADGYIEQLVKRNMVISERDIKTSRFETCHLHDMMREVCLLKAEEDNFVQIIDARIYTSSGYSQPASKSRRLVIQSDRTTMERYTKSPKLRSLLFVHQLQDFHWLASGLLFTRLQFMRVLDLSRANFAGKNLPSTIGNLIHLKYLSLYRARVSHRLPSSIRNLRLLLYLNLHVSSIYPIYVPNVLKVLRELRYLSLPDDIQEKTKLELCDLINLETLENFSTKYSSVSDLQCMTRLGTLSILCNGQECTLETLSSSLSELQSLENLTIRDTRSPEQLELSTYIPRLPDEQHFPSHLRTISLQNCFLGEDPMPVLGKLVHVNVVSLGKNAFAGRRMVCSSGGFPKMHMLELYELDEWEDWILEEASMPFLRVLLIKGCRKLKELPDGMRFITSLKQLTIDKSEREFVENLEREGRDYYKVQHVPLLNLSWTR